MQRLGIVIGTHGHRHADLGRLDDDEVITDPSTCKQILPRRSGDRWRALSHDVGRFRRAVVRLQPAILTLVAAIRHAFSVGDYRFDLGVDGQPYKYLFSTPRIIWNGHSSCDPVSDRRGHESVASFTRAHDARRASAAIS